MEIETQEAPKYWQENNGKPSMMRICAIACVYSGIGMLWAQLIGAMAVESLTLANIEWAGPISLIGLGFTGKVAQKFGEK
jgi:hypothetical protein